MNTIKGIQWNEYNIMNIECDEYNIKKYNIMNTI